MKKANLLKSKDAKPESKAKAMIVRLPFSVRLLFFEYAFKEVQYEH